MIIILIKTRQHHSSSVGKRIVFILWFSHHAKKRSSTHLNQERCWGFGDGFLRLEWQGGNTGEKPLLFPPRGATDDFLTGCKTCWLHVMLRCCWYPTLPGQTSLPHIPNHGIHGDSFLSGSTRNISLYFGIFTAGAAQKFLANPSACFSSETTLDHCH